MSVYRPIAGLSRIAGDYDLLLCDVFGTLHDAERAFPAALDALARFRRGGGTVVLVSNSVEAGDELTLTLAAKGIAATGIAAKGIAAKDIAATGIATTGIAAKGIAGVSDGLVSAGDVTRALLRERQPVSILHIGSARDRRVVGAWPARLGQAPADLVVCTGYPEDDTGLDDVLSEARRRRAPMLCTNPDTSVVAGGRLLRFAGLVAERYRALGGAVTDTGKPGSLIYAAALAAARAATGRAFDPARILGLGDTPALDAGGALDAGYAAALLTTAEAAPPDRPGPGRRYRLPALIW